MFENGLLATFIPEILMVMGFLFCLLAPNMDSASTTAELIPVVVQFSSVEKTPTSTYIASYSDFQQTQQIEIADKQPILFPQTELEMTFFEKLFLISDGLSFDQFSRPPPPLLS